MIIYLDFKRYVVYNLLYTRYINFTTYRKGDERNEQKEFRKNI